MAGVAVAVFDYADLAKPDRAALEKHAATIRGIQNGVRRIAAEGVIQIGEELKAAQDRLAHHGDGEFCKWAKGECGYSKVHAYRFIAAYNVFGVCTNLVQTFEPSALYLLAAPSCPEKARAESLRLAEREQPITHTVAKGLKTKYSKTSPAPTAPQASNGKKPKKLSQKALAAQAAVTQGKRVVDAAKAMGFSKTAYRRTLDVALSAREELIDAMDAELLTPNRAAGLIEESQEEVDAAIEDARLKVAQKKHRAASTKGMTKGEILLDMLEQTWVTWRSFISTHPKPSVALPKNAKQLADCRRLLPQVRAVVLDALNSLEKGLDDV